ncbi:MAG: hypothetical protein LBE95_03695, partial [Holosporaceae bacterium]|nr:hypothetical protein [Holosporaceae bacterium]
MSDIRNSLRSMSKKILECPSCKEAVVSALPLLKVLGNVGKIVDRAKTDQDINVIKKLINDIAYNTKHVKKKEQLLAPYAFLSPSNNKADFYQNYTKVHELPIKQVISSKINSYIESITSNLSDLTTQLVVPTDWQAICFQKELVYGFIKNFVDEFVGKCNIHAIKNSSKIYSNLVLLKDSLAALQDTWDTFENYYQRISLIKFSQKFLQINETISKNILNTDATDTDMGMWRILEVWHDFMREILDLNLQNIDMEKITSIKQLEGLLSSDLPAPSYIPPRPTHETTQEAITTICEGFALYNSVIQRIIAFLDKKTTACDPNLINEINLYKDFWTSCAQKITEWTFEQITMPKEIEENMLKNSDYWNELIKKIKEKECKNKEEIKTIFKIAKKLRHTEFIINQIIEKKPNNLNISNLLDALQKIQNSIIGDQHYLGTILEEIKSLNTGLGSTAESYFVQKVKSKITCESYSVGLSQILRRIAVIQEKIHQIYQKRNIKKDNISEEDIPKIEAIGY